MSQTTAHIYQDVVGRLAAVRKAENIACTQRDILIAASGLLLVFIAVTAAEAIFHLDVLARTVLFWFVVSAGAALALWYAIRPALKVLNILPNESDEATARKIGQQFSGIHDHLVNILQLYRDRGNTKFYSAELIDASFEDIRQEIEPLEFTSIVDRGAFRRTAKILGITAGAGILLFMIFLSAFLGSAERLWNYNITYATPLPFRLIVEPGDADVVKGETITVRIRVEGEPQNSLVLLSKPEGQRAFDEIPLIPSSEGIAAHQFPALKYTTHYYARAGDIRSDEFTLTVVDRPFVKLFRLQLSFPSYTTLASRPLDDNVGDVTAVKGTRIEFALEANKELGEAALVFSDGFVSKLTARGNKASGSVMLTKERTYRFLLKDHDGRPNAEPIEYTLKIVPDAYPTATIVVPGRNLDITEHEALNMLFKITDDFGFSRLRLAHRLVQSRYEKPQQEFTFIDIPLPENLRTEGIFPYLWRLTKLSLVPEDVVSYYIEVFDNDRVSGPKSATSAIFTLRLPSLDEVFSELDRGHEVSLDAMKEALTQAQEAKKDLDELQQELKKNQHKADWQEQQKTQEMLKKYQEIHKKIDEVASTVDQMLKEMEKNQLLSQETLEKYQELQEMMEQMNSPEFAEAMKKLQQAMQQLNPEALKQAMQQFTFSEEAFRKSIERTMNLLKRIQIEQKVDEALKRTEELLRQQEELQAQTERTDPADAGRRNELAQQQRELKDRINELRKQLEDLQKKMEEFPAEMPLEELEKAMSELERSELAEQMEQIAQQMQQQQMQQATQGQRQATQKLGQFMQQMQQMRQALKENQQRQIVNEMRKALRDLLELSKREERLKGESQGLEQNSQRFREHAQQQMEIMRDLGTVVERLAKLSQKTFAISPEMGKSIGDAMREMHEAMQALDQRNGSRAGEQQGGAMSSLNEAAQLLQGSLNAMMQGGGQGMGMAGFMQRLQQLSGQQQGINQGTQNLGGLTPQQAAEMARLAGEQGMVRKSLEQLTKEAAYSGDLSKMLGDLNKIAQEMREVQTDLAQGNVNPETLRKQERILSRLLDSQRSARERDFEKKRRAESGKDVTRQNPGQIDLTTQEGRDRLRQDMLKAIEEGYAKDYELLIRRYFEALEKYEKQN